ncbi:MAG: STAS domain-containing protein [Kiritimatiellia bacterium]|jgi:anti-sigma B factor antagonist
MSALSISTVNPRINIIALSGRLAVETENLIQSQLMEAIKRSPQGLVLDMEAVVFVSSAGLRMLIMVYKSAAASGTKLAMIRPSPEIYKLLKLAALDSTFNVFENEADAVKAIGP